MNIDRVRKAAAMIREGHELLTAGPLDFYLTELAAAHDLLMTRYAPFKVGDRVRLKVTPEITEKEAWGWMCWKWMLVAGATGVVVRADCGSGGFSFGVHFDKDPSTIKGDFTFRENDLEHEV